MRFDPSSHIDDLKDRQTRRKFFDVWDGLIASEIADNIALLKDLPDEDGHLVDTPICEPLFFSEADGAATSTDVPFTWNAFFLAIARQRGAGVA